MLQKRPDIKQHPIIKNKQTDFIDMKILILGARGQLGRELKNELEKRGNELLCPSHAELDITCKEALGRVLGDFRPDAVVNCVAYNQVDAAEEETELCGRINCEANITLARLCDAIGSKLMFFSTDYVFDGEGCEPISEEAPAGPLSVYGKSKADAETVIKNNCGRFFIVRVSWLYNNGCGNFVNTMLRLGASRSEISVVADQIGSPTFAPHLAGPLCDMLESDKFGTYNLTSSGFCSWYEFACEIFKSAGMSVKVNPITTKEYNAPAKRPLNSRLSKDKAIRAGFGPLPDWKAGLKDFFKKENAENI